MALHAFGKVPVPNHGTPVPLSAVPFMCSVIVVTALNANTKPVICGNSVMVQATQAGCYSDWLDPGQGFEFPAHPGLGNHIDAGAVYIDSQVDNEGVVAYAIY